MRREAEGQGCEAEHLHRLRWRCRRGLLELDLWLGRFVSHLGRLSPEECLALESLLEEADADLLAWLDGRQPAPERHARLIGKIRLGG